jgi:hypothetical protein
VNNLCNTVSKFLLTLAGTAGTVSTFLAAALADTVSSALAFRLLAGALSFFDTGASHCFEKVVERNVRESSMREPPLYKGLASADDIMKSAL